MCAVAWPVVQNLAEGKTLTEESHHWQAVGSRQAGIKPMRSFAMTF